MRRKRIKWEFGDLFGVKLKDGSYILVQIIDQMMTNCIYVAVTNIKVDLNSTDNNYTLNPADIISLVCVSKHPFEDGYFPKIGKVDLIAGKADFKNELTKDNGYIGSKIYDGELLEDFLDAYNKLSPWDDWFDPNYLDEFLISLDKKPKDLIYIKS